MPDARAERLAELVKSAIELDPSQREAFLGHECKSDPDLRAEIDSLLEQQKHMARFIEQPALHLAAESLLDERGAHVGETIGDYKVLSLLGRGGMGEVYLAEDRQLHRKAALKLIRRGMDSDDILRHFKQEERLLAGLNHPHIAQLYGGGVTADGTPFFAMEYVDGERFDEFCNRRELPIAERLQLFRKVCSAVAYAHQHLVIHRDLKPANIRVTLEGEPKLLDFGIAKLLDADLAGSGQTLTIPGAMTPEYASPEQIRGESVTTASDTYSLGVVLYELLTDEKPHRLTSRHPEGMARAITGQLPQRPSTVVAGRAHRAEGSPQKSLRGDLDNIVLMAMRKEPARRYLSVGQFSEDIRRHLEGLPVIARKDTLGYRSAKFVRRHRAGVAALALIFLSLVGGIIATVKQTRTAERERAKAEATSTFLQTMLAASNPIVNLRARDLTVKDVLDEASKRLAAGDLSREPDIKAELQRIVGLSYFSVGQYDLAERNLNAALELKNKLFGEDSPEALKTLISLAHIWAGATGDYARANKFYEAKLPLLRAAQKEGKISADWLADSLNGDALLQRAQGDSRKAELLLREQLALRRDFSMAAHDDLSGTESVLALTLADQGKFDEAMKIVRAKLELLRKQQQEGTPAHCGALTGLGSFLIENGDFAEAEEQLRKGEEIYRKLYGPTNMQLGDNLRLQAQALASLQQDAEAETKINEALAIYRGSSNPRYVNYATALMVQGVVASHKELFVEAENLLREAVHIREENLPAPHFLRATAEGALGEFLTSRGRFLEAEKFLLASYDSLKTSQGKNSPRTVLSLKRLVALYEAANKQTQAAAYHELLAGTTR